MYKIHLKRQLINIYNLLSTVCVYICVKVCVKVCIKVCVKVCVEVNNEDMKKNNKIRKLKLKFLLNEFFSYLVKCVRYMY